MGLGVSAVSGCSLVPRPAAKMMALFINENFSVGLSG